MSSGSFFQLLNRGVVNLTTGAPKLTLVVITLLTLVMLRSALHFEENMTRDIEVYLPEGDESTGLLIEVRQEWSTDTILVIIKTRNAIDPDRYDMNPRDNVTAVDTLKNISALEVAIDPWGQSVEQTDFNTCYQSEKGADRGKCDGIVFTLSLSTIIKELNSTGPRFIEALEDKTISSAFEVIAEMDNEQVNETGRYDIPDRQDRIDELVNRTGKTAGNYAIDTNGDGIWDTATILFALKYEKGNNDEAQKEHIKRINGWIAGLKPVDDPEGGVTMGITGLVVVLHDVTDRIYEDLMLMLPLAMGIVIVMMFLYHKTPRILPVVALPVAFAIIWTLGIVQMSGVVLTPMIVAAGPILVGIGVDYGLHVANRINECQHDEGLPFPKAVQKGLATTGRATMLCAFTDIIGFSALMISPIAPMRTVGLTMIVGVTTAFILTILMVPPLMKLFNYRKGEAKVWSRVGEFPVRNCWIILALIVVATMASVAKVSVMQQDIRGDESAPDEIESIKLLAEYSERFNAGQTGVVITRADQERLSDSDMLTAANDTDVLDSLNATQSEISDLWLNNRNSGERVNVSAVSIVDFFKAAHIELTITPEGLDTISFSGSYWDLIHHELFTSDDYSQLDSNWLTYTRSDLRNDLIEVFYESFTDELIAMLISDDYQKTLIYVEMPYINIDDTQIFIDEINQIVDMNNQTIPFGEVAHLTGGPPITVAINAGIQETQWKTIVLSLFLVLGALFGVFYLTSSNWLSAVTFARSWGFAIATWIPILIVVAWQPMTMSAGSTNVNIFTAMIGTIIIGIGIDNAVQISERVREEGVTEKGIARAVEHTGASLVEATSTTAGGVAAGILISLTRTQFVGLQNFFLLIIILIFYTLVGGLLVLPAIYSASISIKRKRGRRVRRAIRIPGVLDQDGRVSSSPPAKKPLPARQKREPPPEPEPPDAELIEAEPIDSDDMDDMDDSW